MAASGGGELEHNSADRAGERHHLVPIIEPEGGCSVDEDLEGQLVESAGLVFEAVAVTMYLDLVPQYHAGGHDIEGRLDERKLRRVVGRSGLVMDEMGLVLVPLLPTQLATPAVVG
jgi:hypothetical protein